MPENDLTVKAGEIVGVVGPVSCGKSSFLLGVCLVTWTRKGKISEWVIAICMQEAGYLMELPENTHSAYKWTSDISSTCRVLLESDLDSFPAGDLTEMGRGVNLVAAKG